MELLAGEPQPVDVPRDDGSTQRIFRCPTCQVAVFSEYGRPEVRFVRGGTLDRAVGSHARRPYLHEVEAALDHAPGLGAGVRGLLRLEGPVAGRQPRAARGDHAAGLKGSRARARGTNWATLQTPTRLSRLHRMEPSEEIRRVIDRWMVAVTEGDADAVLGRVSDHPGGLTIGTDGDEWWSGSEARLVWRRQIEETGGFPGHLERDRGLGGRDRRVGRCEGDDRTGPRRASTSARRSSSTSSTASGSWCRCTGRCPRRTSRSSGGL